MNKYNAKKVIVDGEVFDSKKEAKRYKELRELEENGVITELELQKRFELIPSQKINGKVVERPCYYKCDFQYKKNGEVIVEDTKGFRTDVYKIKKKLMLWIHNIRIVEV